MIAQPKLSILVPVYNVEKYLAQCLSSLVGQSLQDIEIICINDGSTDGSPSCNVLLRKILVLPLLTKKTLATAIA